MREITKTISSHVDGKPADFRLTKLDAFSGAALLRMLSGMPQSKGGESVMFDIEKLESKEYGGIKYYLATYQLASDELNGAAIKSKTAITLYNGYILLFQYLTMSDMYVLDFDSFLNSICFQ